jgi:ribonuclease HI
MVTKKNFYAVFKGRRPGIYTSWFGDNGAFSQVNKYPGAIYEGFSTKEEAEKFLSRNQDEKPAPVRPLTQQPLFEDKKSAAENNGEESLAAPGDRVLIHTDGGALNNPGPGGYGAVIEDGERRIELSGGYRRTTNNRMELMACIKALEYLDKPSNVTLYSDSRYVVDAVSKGWADKWRKNGWMRNKGDIAMNADLWERLLDLLRRHRVDFKWVRGHSGHPENERCDELVRMESAKTGLPADENYEKLEAGR